MRWLYIAGGQQRAGINPAQEWYSYEKALVLCTAPENGTSCRRLEYVTPREARSDDKAAVLFKCGTLEGETLYLCTSTEVMAYDARDLKRTLYLSLPHFNDLHHICPTPQGNLLIAVTGLDMVTEISQSGRILREWDVLGGSPWTRFSRQTDYRQVPSTKPHASHPNFIFQTGEHIWVNRFLQRDAVCLTDPTKRIDIATEGAHDGHVRQEFIYFTTVDGHVVIANHATQKIEHIVRLQPLEGDPDHALGWCRGLLLLDQRLAWIGFSRLRPTKFRQNLAWLRLRSQSMPGPTRIALYDLINGECKREIDLEPYGMNSVFSIFDATPFEALPCAPTEKGQPGSERAPVPPLNLEISVRMSGAGYDLASNPHLNGRGSHSPPKELAERILMRFARSSEEQKYSGATANYTLANALSFARLTIPNFHELIRDKSILDYGCGPGWQSVAMYTQLGARSVLGVDIRDEWLHKARLLAESANCQDHVTFSHKPPADLTDSFDVAISLCSFDHFADPAAVLATMRSLLKQDGLLIISFAEPWFSPHGSHMNDYTKLPWVNVLFPEPAVMRFRSHFRSDGAVRYEDVKGGLNRMTLGRFERIVRTSGMTVEMIRYRAVRGVPLVCKIPLVREFLTAAATCILTNRGVTPVQRAPAVESSVRK